MGNPIFNMMNNTNLTPMNNPMMDLILAIKQGNPQMVLAKMAAQNPEINQAMQLLQGKTPQDMEQICRNLCAQKGINFDQALAQAKQLMR